MAQAAATRASDQREPEAYALWAPILLLHLGAPDNISAYATADAELWMRHGFIMLYEVATVVYVAANCARTWKFVLLSVCLTALGSIKYAERVLALKRASKADITESALPIYQYMMQEGNMHLEIKGTKFSPAPSSQPTHESASSTANYYYIIRGEKQWLANFQKLAAGETADIQQFEDAAKETPELVTLQDILSSNDLIRETPSVVLLCVGFALFKLFKRRLCHLHLHEMGERKTHELFLAHSDSQNLGFVLDVELRFLFDSLYTKAAGTAFSKMGVIFRILSTVLLGVTAVFILGGKLDLHNQANIKQARDITFCLISAALVIEVHQLLRLVSSDWFKVWLAGKYILIGEKLRKKSTADAAAGRRRSCFSFLKGSSIRWQAALILRVLKAVTSWVRRHEYWVGRIGQYSLIAEPYCKLTFWQNMNAKLTCLMFSRDSLQVVPDQYEQSKQTVAEFKEYVLSGICSGGMDLRVFTARSDLENPHVNFKGYVLSRMLTAGSDFENQAILEAILEAVDGPFENLVVNLHVATCLCLITNQQPPIRIVSDVGTRNYVNYGEQQQPAVGATTDADHDHSKQADQQLRQADDICMSKLLSRYMMYLIVHKAELLPCHADIARKFAADTQRDVRQCTKVDWDDVKSVMAMLQTDQYEYPLPSNLAPGRESARLLQLLVPAERWRLIATMWMTFLMHAAISKKTDEHLQQLTLGGEFLTNIWVLLGHVRVGPAEDH